MIIVKMIIMLMMLFIMLITTIIMLIMKMFLFIIIIINLINFKMIMIILIIITNFVDLNLFIINDFKPTIINLMFVINDQLPFNVYEIEYYNQAMMYLMKK